MVPEIPPPLRAAFTTRERGSASAIVRRDFADDFERLDLIGAAERTAAEILEAAGGGRLLTPDAGRGELALLPTGPGPGAVVRPFRRGGLPGRVAERRYMLGYRAFRELVVTERLRRAGAAVPVPLAAVQSRAIVGYRAALVTRYLPRATPAPELLDGRAPDGCRPALRSMGLGAGRLHAAGGWHADLNAGNFLVASPLAAATIVDLDRGRVLGPPLHPLLARWNLRRLRRSLRKLELEAALEAWDAFEEGYARESGEG